jgi:hypothetical protein
MVKLLAKQQPFLLEKAWEPPRGSVEFGVGEAESLGQQPLGPPLLTLKHHLGPIAEQQLQYRRRHRQQAGPA